MRVGVLFSGGKDSTLALALAQQHHTIACLITLVSENKESYMFHTPNIDLTALQAQALGIPLVRVVTKGEKEAELEDLKQAVKQAQKQHAIEGIVTGAVRSTYQASRVQRICHELGVWCFNPLWLKNQLELLNDVLAHKITAIISGVFADALTEDYLGKTIDAGMIERLSKVAATHHISPAGEGGEIETTVIDAPFFKKQIVIAQAQSDFEKNSGVYAIQEARLEDK